MTRSLFYINALTFALNAACSICTQISKRSRSNESDSQHSRSIRFKLDLNKIPDNDDSQELKSPEPTAEQQFELVFYSQNYDPNYGQLFESLLSILRTRQDLRDRITSLDIIAAYDRLSCSADGRTMLIELVDNDKRLQALVTGLYLSDEDSPERRHAHIQSVFEAGFIDYQLASLMIRWNANDSAIRNDLVVYIRQKGVSETLLATIMSGFRFNMRPIVDYWIRPEQFAEAFPLLRCAFLDGPEKGQRLNPDMMGILSHLLRRISNHSQLINIRPIMSHLRQHADEFEMLLMEDPELSQTSTCALIQLLLKAPETPVDVENGGLCWLLTKIDRTAVTKSGDTILHLACRAGCWLGCALPELRDQINRPNSRLELPLHVAARIGLTDNLESLLADPAIDVRARDLDGNTALHLFLMPRDYKHAVYLIDRNDIVKGLALFLQHGGLDINAPNNEGETLLHIAARGHCGNVVRRLLEHPKILIYTPNKKGRKAVDIANDAAQGEIADLIRRAI